jgi:NADH-quinone oxidoreductase subunit N
MIVGAFASLVQVNIKRLMAYSAIGHVGYALIGVAVGTPEGIGAAVFYMIVYMIMAAGTFSVILLMRRDNFALEDIDDLAGLSKSSPFIAYAMALMMFSLSGIPPLAGFFGKLAVFGVAVQEGFYILAITGVLTSVVAAFYYLRIIKVMLFDENVYPLDESLSFSCRAVMLLASIFVIVFAFNPEPLIGLANDASQTLFVR